VRELVRECVGEKVLAVASGSDKERVSERVGERIGGRVRVESR